MASPASASAAPFAVTIRGGTLVTAEDGERRADIGIDADGRVAAIGAPTLPPGNEDIDATGLFLLPGGVDSHCHIEQKTSTGLTPVDDFFTASVSALSGGTTTIIPFACQHRGQRIRDVVEAYKETAAKAAADYAFHIIVADPSEAHATEDLRQCFADGFTSVKIYMTYDALKLRDEEFLDVLALCRSHGAMVMVHAESHELIAWITRRLLSAERIAAKFHAVARPAVAEREAAHRAISFAEFIGTPLLIVHVSSSQATDEIRRARQRGLPIYGETCPQYLTLTQSCLCSPGGEGNKFLCSPPLRTEADQNALWAALRAGDLQVVSSDHSAYNFGGGSAASKTAGGPMTPFTKVPMGLPGLETRMPLLVSAALPAPAPAAAAAATDGSKNDGERKLESLAQAVACACTNPAKLYGLYPRKGTLQVGSDADVVLIDASVERLITKSALHDTLDYTPYEGVRVRGGVVRTLLRGTTVYDARAPAPVDVLRGARRGGGQLLACGAPDLLGWVGSRWPDAADVVEQRCAEALGPALDGEGASARKRGRRQ